MVKQQHRYEACRDRECERLPCRAWKEGRAEGYRDGHEDGYVTGFDAGVIACPRPHEST